MESRIHHSSNKPGIVASVMIVFFFSTVISLAQELDSVKVDSLMGVASIHNSKNHYLKTYKLSSGRTFRLVDGHRVRIYSHKIKNNRVRTKSAVISKMEDHQVTFTPTSKKFNEIVYADSSLSYIEIVTAESVIVGAVINAVLVSVVVVTVGVILIGSLVAAFYGASYGGSGTGLGNFIGILPWSNFHKYIKFINNRGIEKWGARVVSN